MVYVDLLQGMQPHIEGRLHIPRQYLVATVPERSLQFTHIRQDVVKNEIAPSQTQTQMQQIMK